MLIYIDGTDRTGKTRLARRLARRTRATVIHRGPPTGPTLLHHGAHLAAYRPGDRWILDRNHWSDLAYGPLYHPEERLGELGAFYLDLALEARGAVVVLGRTATPEEAAARVRRLGDDYLREEDAAAVWAAFEAAADGTLLPVWQHDFQEEPVDEDALLETARARAAEAAPALTLAPEAVGFTSLPSHLLVGDRVEGSAQWRLEFPLPFAPLPGSSGHYLWENLAGTVEAGRARPLVVNARDSADAPVDLAALWETLGRPPTVALGNHAQAALAAAGVRHGVVPHPQFVRRFKYRHGVVYATALLRAAEHEGDLRAWLTSLT